MKSNRRPFHEFIEDHEPGDISCIISDNRRKLISTFYSIIRSVSETKNVGYLVTKIQYGKQNLYLQSNSISQSVPLNSFEDIENEIKRLAWISESPVIFIKDYFKTIIGSSYWQNSQNANFKEATERLRKVAKKYKVAIYTTMLFRLEVDLRKYFLQFERTGNGLIRNKTEDFYFDKQLCLHRSKDYSYKARQNVHHKLLLAHPGLRSIGKYVIVSSIIGKGNCLWFSHPYPYIFIGTPFMFDKRLVPIDFMGYNILRTSCGLPFSRYFPKDRSIAAEEKYSPENLIRFVNNHLELISWKMNRPDLSKEEALDALTGGFEAHKQECIRRKKAKE